MSAPVVPFNQAQKRRAAAALDDDIAECQAQDLDGWPIPLQDGGNAPDLPADLVPGWLGRYVAAVAGSTQTPPALAIGMALATVATTVQRRYRVAPYGLDSEYRESASVFTQGVAASGSRKSAIVDAFTWPLQRWEKNAGDRMRREINAVLSRILVADSRIKSLQAQAGKADDPGERERLREQIELEETAKPERLYPPRLFLGDATVERLQGVLTEQGGRAAVLSDEGGLFSTISGSYGGGAGPALDVLLQGYSGGALRVERNTRSAYVDRAAITLGLMLQPGLVAEAAGSNRFRASGLMARFLFFVPAPFVGGRDVRQFAPVPQALREEYGREIDALLPDPTEGPHLPPIDIPLNEEAREVFLDFAQEVEDRLGAGGDLEAVGDWAAKLAGQAARVALLFELVTSGPGLEVIPADSMRAAVKLCHALIPHARAAFRLLAADQVDHDADHVLQWVLGRDDPREFTQHELHHAMRSRFTRKERLVAALQRLQANGCLRHSKRANKGARATDIWQVNPRLFLADVSFVQ